ncbi:MAG: YbgA family protein [Candidatus Riflebacteria bacterium]|nr:YbgA family protein [Candidatus Riflebacteria bacterium]
MPPDIHPAYLEPFLFCGLCFGKMTLQNGLFSCPTGCTSGIPAQALEEVLWREMGRLLARPKGRQLARKLLGEALTASRVKHLFQDLKNFVEFLPPEEKQHFATALVEKIEIVSGNAVKIHFRS